MVDKIGFCIVVYEEDFKSCQSYITLLNSLQEVKEALSFKIYIYDNSKIPLSNNNSSHENVAYVHDPKNPGISVAYNYMAAKASAEGMKWLILLDQDTTLPSDFVSGYLKDIEAGAKLIVPIVCSNRTIISPFKLFFFRPSKLQSVLPGLYDIRQFAFINTGLMIDLEFFHQVGGYNENIKLDFADFQFIERAKPHTRSFQVIPVTCEQNFSHHSDNLAKALKRYSIYIHDLHNCHIKDPFTYLGYKVNGFLHLLKLTYRYKTMAFIKMNIKL